MKKILLLLILVPLMAISQTIPADATALENLQITNNTTSPTAPFVTVQETNGVMNKINKADLVNVVEVNDVPSLPLIGEVGKIYVVKNVNKIYRWNGTFYQELSGSDLNYQSIIDALNYVPENVVNKVTDIATGANNTTYPTSLAVKTYADNLTSGTLNYIPKYIAGSKIASSLLFENTEGLRYGTQKTAYAYGLGVSRLITSLDRHIFDDYSVLDSTVGGFGFGVFDASTEMTGSQINDHFVGYQSRLGYTSSVGLVNGTIANSMIGFLYRHTHSGLGTLKNTIGLKLDNVQGGGVIENQYGLYIEPYTRGSISNWEIYSPGVNNHFGSISVNTLSKTNAFNLQGKTNSYVISGNYGGILAAGKRYSALSIGKSSSNGENGIVSYYTDEGNTTLSGMYLLNWGDPETNNSIFLKRGGNVGLGTFSPTEKLHVVGKGLFTSTVTASPATVDTELATLGQAKAVARPYKVYTALLSQSGTNAPVATVLENTLGGTVVWARSNTGSYTATLTGAFTPGKVVTFSGLNAFADEYFVGSTLTSINYITLITTNISSNLIDNALSGMSYEIRVYN